ncbi:MAG: hypothetical protein CVV51_03665, partial [Spirochaetae bacterium HGW-Spirochaetae-7]
MPVPAFHARRLTATILFAFASTLLGFASPGSGGPAPGTPDSGERFSFRHLDTGDGLSGDSVYCMLQDRLGYLWLGTFSGLSRYDGARVVIYRPVPGDPESLPSSLIFDIHEDYAGTLWIATDGGGLARYSRDSDAFERFSHDQSIPGSLGSDRIFTVADDPYGWIWVGTADAGLDRFDSIRGVFAHYGMADGLPSDTIRTLLCDADGELWVGTTAGLARYDRMKDSFLAIGSTGKSTVRALMQDRDGNILVGTEGRGVFSFDPETGTTSAVALGAGSETLLVRAFAMENSGRVWVGTEDKGIRILDSGGTSSIEVRAAPAQP